MLIGSIVLVNLLVAMFADTYARVKMAAEKEYHFVRYKRIFEHKHILHPCPPPLNIPFAIFGICKHHLAKFDCCRALRPTIVKLPPTDDKIDGRQLMGAYKERVQAAEANTVDSGVKQLRASVHDISLDLDRARLQTESRGLDSNARFDKLEEQVPRRNRAVTEA